MIGNKPNTINSGGSASTTLPDVFLGSLSDTLPLSDLLDTVNLTVEKGTIPVLFVTRKPSKRSQSVARRYLWKLGAGEFNPIGGENIESKLELIEETFLSVQNLETVLTSENAEEIPLKVIAEDFISYMNNYGAYALTNVYKTYIITFTKDDIDYAYIFQGALGTYGAGNLQFVADDFIFIYQSENQGQVNENATEEFFCITRLLTGGNTWQFVNDSVHLPSSNIQGIITNPATGFNFGINHNNGYTKVGSVLATVDETYASFGLKIGASVGLTQSLFTITKDGFTIRGLVSGGIFQFASDVGQIVINTDFTYTFDTVTGRMVISHPSIVCTYGDGVILTPYNTNLTIRLITKNSTSLTFEWYNNGVLVTALSSSMRLYLTRTGTFQCTNEQIGNTGANFWIRGIMKK